MKQLFAIIAAFAISLGAWKALSLPGGGPTVESPLPLPLFLLWAYGFPLALLPFLPAAAFLAWQPRIFLFNNGTSIIPMPVRTWILVLGLSLSSVAWFLAGWEFGVRHHGGSFVCQCAWISVGLGTASIVLCAIAAWSKNVFANLLAHAILFYWAASYAFPYLWELL
jgi:hypothetical protein